MKTIRFGKLDDGRTAGLYILESPDGMRAAVTDYGASLVSLAVSDAKGIMRDVVLGYDDVSGYENGDAHIGATVGRFANRIAGAGFRIGDTKYGLTPNNGDNCLHGGRDYYGKRLWQVKIGFASVHSADIMSAFASESISDKSPSYGLRGLGDNKITFLLDSPDGDQGFPGNLHLEVTYSFPGNGELRIDYEAVSDRDTPVSFTNHSYFNLNGHDSGTVLGHMAKVNADCYSPVNEGLIPCEADAPVEGTPFDFREFRMIGSRISADDQQLLFGNGYDHNFVTAAPGERQLHEAAAVCSEDSGIRMQVLTDMPDIQMYTANGLDGEAGKEGAVYGKRSAICLETQFRPDAVNNSNPDISGGCILKAGETFRSATIYKFSNL